MKIILITLNNYRNFSKITSQKSHLFNIISLILVFSLFILSFNGQAFTLSSSQGRGFSHSNITIEVALTDCSNAGFTTSQFVDLIKNATNKYWNSVPSSSLKLNVTGISNIDIDGETSLRNIITNKVKTGTILAGCNDDLTANTSNIGGVATLSCPSEESCRGALVMNATINGPLPTLDKESVIAIIAHELGHALGLGHSQYKHSLMYFLLAINIKTG